MENRLKIKSEFIEQKEQIFNDSNLLKNAFKLSLQFSSLVEEYIFRVVAPYKIKFTIASVGSFSRRELSPYSDIDVMFIIDEENSHNETIQKIITELWDCGIEVAHTIRMFSDIEKFLEEDLHSFTQFFETRYLIGNREIYNKWNQSIFQSVDSSKKDALIEEYFQDTKKRYKKFGDSPKVLEPNIKSTAGGLRDLQVLQWIYALKNEFFFTNQSEITQTEYFLETLEKSKIVFEKEIERLKRSYEFILNTRNHVHLIEGHRTDRFEFRLQEKISNLLPERGGSWLNFMKNYFNATSTINRFTKTMSKLYVEQMMEPISDFLSIDLDDDFVIKGNVISIKENKELSMSEILRAFYYRGINDARFDENLRSQIIQNTEEKNFDKSSEHESSVFFREILRIPKVVSKTLLAMNELGVLGAFLPEFKELIGFFQPGVYHCYTADEHTLIALRHCEELYEDDSRLGRIYKGLKRKDIIHLAILFHDIAKPVSVSGHEIIGGEIAGRIMEELGYDQEEIELVQFLVRHHLTMEQVAFRRNLNDPNTLDNFGTIFPSLEALDLLYLLTYSDLSAVNNVVWTQWKSDQLFELYRKARVMLEQTITGDELLYNSTMKIIKKFENHDDEIKEHVESINDVGYFHHFSNDEIEQHIAEIEKGINFATFFREEEAFTNVTILAKDTPSLLSKLCGALSINDVNIHDARIFTRKDGVVIDSFNVTDFRTDKVIEKERYGKIELDLSSAVKNELQINKEFSRLKTKWWRLENKLFRRRSKVKIRFEDHEKYTIIDVSSPDRLGLLYQITRKMADIGLSIYFAKISTKGDDVIDSFYTLDRNGKKVSAHDYEMIKVELTDTIQDML